LTNTSGSAVLMSHLRGPRAVEDGYDLDIRDALGNRVALKKEPVGSADYRDLVPQKTVLLSLDPGKSARMDLDLNTRHDLSKPGRYTIQVQRDQLFVRVNGQLRSDDKLAGSRLKSNVIVLTVTN
jgi:hypothetical protein